MNMNPTEAVAILGVIDPDVTAAGAVSTAWVDAGNFDRFLAIVMAGTLGTSATIDAKVEQAQDASGTGVKDLIVATQVDESDKQIEINVRNQQLDLANNFSHIRLTFAVGAATSDAAGLLLGFSPMHYPASDLNAGSVAVIA